MIEKTIKIDASEVYKAAENIMSLADSKTLVSLPDRFRNKLLSFVRKGIDDSCIKHFPPTSTTGDHICRLGVSGDLKLFTEAARTGKYDI